MRLGNSFFLLGLVGLLASFVSAGLLPQVTDAPTPVANAPVAHPEITDPPTHELVKRDGGYIGAHTLGLGSVCKFCGPLGEHPATYR